MVATLVHAFGTGRRRKPYVSAEAQGRKADYEAKAVRDAKRPSARFTVKEVMDFQRAAAKLIFQGDPDGVRADALLSRKIRGSKAGFISLAPLPEDAAFLAGFLRRPEVNGFCVGLARLDEIAGIPKPEGKAIDITPTELVESLNSLEAIRGEHGLRAAVAAGHLRTATIHRAMARIYVAGEARKVIADALHAIGASRITVNKFDGGTGFRPRVQPPA